MGVIRFAVPASTVPSEWPEVLRGYLTGADGRVYSTRMEWSDGVASCRRTSSESCKFHVAWPVIGFGRPVIQTASLPERDEPYLLPVELARGKIVQLRNQASQWELAGLTIPEESVELSRQAHRKFAQAVNQQADPVVASQRANEALELACRAADCLTIAYGQQAQSGRQQRYPQLKPALGCEIFQAPPEGLSAPLAELFNAVTIPIRWSVIEPQEGDNHWETADALVDWAEDHRLVVRGGPLLDFGPQGLPAWLGKWSGDVLNLQSFICDFVETALGRYAGRIRWWEVAARSNTGGVFGLTEEQRLTLLARAIEVARQVDDEAQLVIRIDRPWGEYLAAGQHRLAALQMVDALLRSGVGLSAVNLEIAVGYDPVGTFPRDLMDFSRLIDTWSVLGIPLLVTLACPSSTAVDTECQLECDVDPRAFPSAVSEAQQRAWIERYLPLLMAKPAVAGVTWTHLHDADPHDYPNAGLIHRDGVPKPAWSGLKQIRWPAT